MWVKKIGCDGIEWIDGKASEVASERHSMEESMIRLQRRSNGEVKNEID